MKSYTNLEQSKKLAEILPLESADMVLPFKHPKNDEYIPEYVVSRNYVEAYNEMIKLPAMEKEDVYKLIQPTWSLAALLDVLPESYQMTSNKKGKVQLMLMHQLEKNYYDNPVDACYEMIMKLHELKML